MVYKRLLKIYGLDFIIRVIGLQNEILVIIGFSDNVKPSFP